MNPPANEETQAVLDAFKAKYKAEFGEEPSSLTCLMYDCIDILIKAAESSRRIFRTRLERCYL